MSEAQTAVSTEGSVATQQSSNEGISLVPRGTSSAAAGSTQSVSAGQQAPSENSQSWRDSLPEELRSEPTLSKFNDVSSLAKSYLHAQKTMGSDKVVVPGKHATPEDWRNFYHKAGLPESVDKYEIQAPKDAKFEDGFVTNFKKWAHEKGLMPNQANETLSFLNQREAERGEQMKKAAEERYAKGLQSLKSEYGEALKGELGRAQQIVREFGDDEFLGMLDNDGLGDDPRLINFLIKMSKALKEDVVKGSEENTALTPASAQEEFNSMVGDANSPYRQKNHPNHQAAVQHALKLMQMIHGS